MTFLLTGGGTGGHLSIASALLKSIKDKGHRALYIGSTAGQDKAWFAENEDLDAVYFFETTGVVNQKGLKKFKALLKIFKAFLRSRYVIQSTQIDAVISVGGFSAAAASFAALSLKVPYFIHEQNAVTGRLNALLKPYAQGFFSSYNADSKVKGYPVNSVLFETAHIRREIKTVIFLGGSQGAQFINDLALQLAPTLHERGITIIHQSGERDYERLKSAYEALNLYPQSASSSLVAHVELYGFTKELPALLARSDLAVSRAGASTLWELCANALPAFYIPYPYAAADHQFYNAQFLVEKKLAWCERQNENLHENIMALFGCDIAAMSEGLMSLGGNDAAAHIIEYIEETV